MNIISFDKLKHLVTEGFDEPTADDWQWCVANVSKSKYDTATYEDSEPWLNDLSAYELPRGNWMGYCRTETKEDADELLDMMREYDAKYHVRPYHYQYAVVSRKAFEANCFRNTGNWDDDLPGQVIRDPNANRYWGIR